MITKETRKNILIKVSKRLELFCMIKTDHCPLWSLPSQVGKLSEELAAMTHQLERVTREKVDVTSELDQAKMQIMQHEVQITKV